MMYQLMGPGKAGVDGPERQNCQSRVDSLEAGQPSPVDKGIADGHVLSSRKQEKFREFMMQLVTIEPQILPELGSGPVSKLNLCASLEKLEIICTHRKRQTMPSMLMVIPVY
jgi:hypothetical protein